MLPGGRAEPWRVALVLVAVLCCPGRGLTTHPPTVPATTKKPTPASLESIIFGAVFLKNQWNTHTLSTAAHLDMRTCELGSPEETMLWFTIDSTTRCQLQPVGLGLMPVQYASPDTGLGYLFVDWAPGDSHIKSAGFFCDSNCSIDSCNVTLSNVPFFECFEGTGYDVMFFNHNEPCVGPVRAARDAPEESIILLQYLSSDPDVCAGDPKSSTKASAVAALSLVATGPRHPQCRRYTIPGVADFAYSLVRRPNGTFDLSLSSAHNRTCHLPALTNVSLNTCVPDIDVGNSDFGSAALIDLPSVNLCKTATPPALTRRQSMVLAWGALGLSTVVVIVVIFLRSTSTRSRKPGDPPPSARGHAAAACAAPSSHTSRGGVSSSDAGSLSGSFHSSEYDLHSAGCDTGYDSDEPLLNPYEDLLPMVGEAGRSVQHAS